MSDPGSAPPGRAEKRVTWAELFFDLVFVFAVTQDSVLLHADHGVLGVFRAIVVFVPIYWLWVGTSIQANLSGVDRPIDRFVMFAVALGGLFMALAVSGAYDGRSVLFAGSYWASRLVLGSRMVLGGHFSWNPFSVSMVVTGPLLTVGAVLTGDARLVVWTLAAALELSTPTVFRRQLQGIHYDAGHLSERFGAFVLIAIGESIVAVGAPAAGERHLTAAELASVAVAFVLCCGLWWVYFQFATDAMRHALATAQVQLNVTRHVLSYGHILFIASIMTIAVGMTEAVSQPTTRLGWDVVALLFVGCAVYLAAFGYTRWMMFKKVSSTRLTAAALMLVALPLARALPAIAALGVAASVLAGLNIVEYVRVARERRAGPAKTELSEANPR